MLAAVEAARGDGKSVILGTVMAYDLLLGLSEALPTASAGLLGGASFQVIATAAVASRLFGLSATRCARPSAWPSRRISP